MVYILLLYGRFETEYGLMKQGDIKIAFQSAGLFDPNHPDESLDILMTKYIRGSLAFQPGSVLQRDRNIILAESVFREFLMDDTSNVAALRGTPCVLQASMKTETTTKVITEKRQQLSSFIVSIHTDLVNCGFDMHSLPTIAAIKDKVLPPGELMLGDSDGIPHHQQEPDVDYTFPPVFQPDGRQSLPSYTEQNKVLEIAKRTIHQYQMGLCHKNMIVCGGPGIVIIIHDRVTSILSFHRFSHFTLIH